MVCMHGWGRPSDFGRLAAAGTNIEFSRYPDTGYGPNKHRSLAPYFIYAGLGGFTTHEGAFGAVSTDPRNWSGWITGPNGLSSSVAKLFQRHRPQSPSLMQR